MTDTTNHKRQCKPLMYHHLDVWAIPAEVFKLPKAKRSAAMQSYIQSSPTQPNLTRQAPISFGDHALAMLGLFVTLGGPLVWLFASFYCLLFGIHRIWVVVVSLLLMFHPLPHRNSKFVQDYAISCRFTLALYKYFTYRFVWVDSAVDNLHKAAPWIGAGPPHGVMPFANILSVPAINSVLGVNFCGAPASIVFRTPFLRYLTIYPSVHVGRKSIAAALKKDTCVGLVPDGIAGIFTQSPHRQAVALQNRKGMARLSIKEGGVAILPAYSFGNTAAFDSWWDSFGIMERLSRKLQASLFVYWGRFGLPIPRRAQITMVFGDPILPSNENVDVLHDKVLAAIRDCFECHKESLGWGDQELVYV